MGAKLLKQIASATGLPQGLVEKDLIKLIEEQGLDATDVSLDDIRDVLAKHLRTVLLEAKEEIENDPEILA